MPAAALAAALLLASAPGPRHDAPLVIATDAAQGSERAGFVQDAGERIVDEVRAAGCFRSAVPAPPGGPPAGALVLEVTFSEFEVETTFDASLGEVASPRSLPETAERYTARIEFRVDLALGPPGNPRARGSFVEGRSRRPRMMGEDAAAAVREEAIEEAARRVRKWACGVPVRKLADPPAR